jgi:hypothetical protein
MRSLVFLLALVACRESSAPQPTKVSDSDAPRQRVFTPSPGKVRAVPPYNIEQAGVGLYTLGAELRAVLALLPHGPRVELLDLEGIVKYSLVRADDDRILVGVDSTGLVSFIAVLSPDIAKVEGGLGVGAAIDEMREALGPELAGRVARDPRVVELERLPNARIVVEEDEVLAIVMVADRPSSGRAPEPEAAEEAEGPCTRAAEILAGPLPVEEGTAAYGCFTGASPELVVAGQGEVVLYGGEPGRLRRVVAVPVPGLLFAAGLDVDRDGRHELIAVSERRGGDALASRIVIFRGEGGRLVPVADKEVYRVTSGAAAWVGAKLKDMRFLLRVVPVGPSLVEVRGLYLHQVSGGIRHIAPLLPETVALRPRKAATGSGSGSGDEKGTKEGGKEAEKEKPAKTGPDKKLVPEPETSEPPAKGGGEKRDGADVKPGM